MSGDLVLYRFFDADGSLLYIGKAVNAWRRLLEHKHFLIHHTVTTITLQHGFDDEAALLAAEAEAIWSEQPKLNKNHKTRQGRVPVVVPDDQCQAGNCVGLQVCRRDGFGCGCCLRDRIDAGLLPPHSAADWAAPD